MFKRQKFEGRNKPREFHVLSNTSNRYVSNFIKTSKYNLITFLPKSILIQFKRYANVYFLAAAILQSIPSISPLNPFTAIAPFVIVITLSVLREGLEDYPRHKSDQELNASITNKVLPNGQLHEVTWGNVEVGQLIYVQNEEIIPADLILIRSSDPNNFCFIETASLDGEKNLKPKLCDEYGRSYIDDKYQYNENLISKWKMYAPTPDPLLYQYEGYITLDNDKKIPITQKNLLLRGARVKNTRWAIGIAVYTGMDTKIMKNAEKSKYKQSAIERLTNKFIVFILICQLTFCAITAIGNSIWLSMNNNNHWYLGTITNYSWESFRVFLASFLLYNTMIPISLIVSLEFVKLIQAYFIQSDDELFVEEKNKGVKVFTMSINEELGQVSYIFSDKTGTLTCNQMEFKNCVVGDEVYGDGRPRVYANSMATPADNMNLKDEMLLAKENKDSKQNSQEKDKFYDNGMHEHLDNKTHKNILIEMKGKEGEDKLQYAIRSQKDLIIEFWNMMSICHECVVETNQKTGEQSYQSSSPDEVALVESAKSQGFTYQGTHNNVITCNILGQERKWQLLRLFEFNSDRKRMTVVAREGNLIKMYVKGADSIIKKRLRKDFLHPNLSFTDDRLNYFSNLGLRTLVYAMRIMEENEYLEMEKKLDGLIDAQNREEKILQIAEEYERDFYLIGATAVEDKLQRNVPEVIHNLLRANIKVWMLTGDKFETAENIAYSCKLFTGEMSVMRLAETDRTKVEAKMRINYEIHNECLKFNRKMAFIIEGEALTVVFQSPELEKLFLEITSKCAAVVCCRAIPKQKAHVVRLIKKSTGKITLAIGDGANDVNMIQEAHIGVGLYGNEGMRAVQASDYALAEFQGLYRLLLVHGRWCYIRIAEMIMYFFYKNMIFTLPAFYFAFLTAFSASTIYDDWYWSCYNMIFTALPLVIKAIFEQDFNYRKDLSKVNGDTNPEKSLLYQETTKKLMPLIYYIGQENKIFKISNFLMYLTSGALQGVFIFIYEYAIGPSKIMDQDGANGDMWYFSILLYTTVFVIVTTKLVITQRYWIWINFVSLIICSIGIYILFQFVYDKLPSYNKAAYSINMLYSTPYYYLLIIFCWGVVTIYEFCFIFVKKTISKDKSEVLHILLNSNIDKYITQVQELCKESDKIFSSPSNENQPHHQSNPSHPSRQHLLESNGGEFNAERVEIITQGAAATSGLNGSRGRIGGGGGGTTTAGNYHNDPYAFDSNHNIIYNSNNIGDGIELIEKQRSSGDDLIFDLSPHGSKRDISRISNHSNANNAHSQLETKVMKIQQGHERSSDHFQKKLIKQLEEVNNLKGE